MNDKQWYVASGGQQQGPFTVDSLRQQGAFAPDTLVWADGMAEWQPIAATPLAGLLSGGMPPMPGAPPRMTAPPYQAATAGGGGAPPLGFVAAIKTCLAKYVTFEGRASRSEYWWFVLFFVLVYFAAAILDRVIGTDFILTGLVFLGLILPIIAAAVRRLHDTDRSGWWYLLNLVPIGNIVVIVFCCLRGTPGQNRFG